MTNFILNILIFTIVTSVLKGMIVKDEYKQYFQFFCGLIMILLVITPVINFFGAKDDYYAILQKHIYSLELQDSVKEINTADGKMKKEVVKQCERTIEKQVKKMAQENDVKCSDVKVESKTKGNEFEIVSITINMNDGAVAAYADISHEKKEMNKNEKRLKNDICSSYMLDGEKVQLWK